MTRARDLADSADKDIAGTLTVDDITASGTITGDTAGTHTGAVTGNVTGNLTGDVTGNTTGTHIGAVTGNVTGNVTGDVTGSVTASAMTVNGAFASQGIDDNATSTAMTLDASGNLLVGMTTNSVTGTGIGLVSDGTSHMYSGGTHTLELGRGGSDGDILEFNRSGTSVGSISSEGGKLVVNSQGSNLVFAVGGTSKANMDVSQFYPQTDGGLNLSHPSVRWQDLYLSGGVYLGGTGSANKLEDYEEGTFTATFSGATVSPANTSGVYTKIGGRVFWSYYTQTATISSSSGALIMGGLPYTIKNVNGNYAGVIVGMNTFFGSGTNGINGYHQINQDYIYFINPGTTSSPTAVNGSGKYLMAGGMYEVA